MVGIVHRLTAAAATTPPAPLPSRRITRSITVQDILFHLSHPRYRRAPEVRVECELLLAKSGARSIGASSPMRMIVSSRAIASSIARSTA